MDTNLRPIDRRMFNGEIQVEGDAWSDYDSEKLEAYLTGRQIGVDKPIEDLEASIADPDTDYSAEDAADSLTILKNRQEKITKENDYTRSRMVSKADYGK